MIYLYVQVTDLILACIFILLEISRLWRSLYLPTELQNSCWYSWFFVPWLVIYCYFPCLYCKTSSIGLFFWLLPMCTCPLSIAQISFTTDSISLHLPTNLHRVPCFINIKWSPLPCSLFLITIRTINDQIQHCFQPCFFQCSSTISDKPLKPWPLAIRLLALNCKIIIRPFHSFPIPGELTDF